MLHPRLSSCSPHPTPPTAFVIACVGCLPWFILTMDPYVVSLSGLVEMMRCVVGGDGGREQKLRQCGVNAGGVINNCRLVDPTIGQQFHSWSTITSMVSPSHSQ